ncbi:MAG: SRPBCC family protein [Actinomycetota bacterium]
MELTNEFVIDRDVEETWKILNDLEFIAPCMPGAQLTEIEGDEYRGLVKIKVGPITANYKGKASFIEQDVANKVAKLKAEGRDPRQGNANAMVTATMAPAGDNQTTVNIHTDLGLSGKIASFGRGAIEDVSKKILGQFTDNLREKLETTDVVPADADDAADAATDDVADAAGAAAAAVGDTANDTAAGDASTAAGDTAAAAAEGVAEAAADAASAVAEEAKPTVRKIEGPEAEAVDLLAVSGGSIMKRLIPTVGVAAAVAAIIYWIIN